jgi:hypothetical protein
MRTWLTRGIIVVALSLASGVLVWGGSASHGQTLLPPVPNPDDRDLFDLDLDGTIALSQRLNFEVVGHSYLRGPWLVPGARGAGINTPRVHDGIAYLGGYNGPPTMFGTLIVDVHDPRSMQPLTFLPASPGTRTAYVRLNTRRNILVVGYDVNAANPDQPPVGEQARGGLAFFDVSDPSHPVELAQYNNGKGVTHGFEIDDRYAYACASSEASKEPADRNLGLAIVDYADPAAPRLVSSYHIVGTNEGETSAFMDDRNPDGTPQVNWCHEVNKDGDRLYVAWRDAGFLILDVSDPANPQLVGRWDYVPPYNGGRLGAAHTAAPVPHPGAALPSLLVLTDEIFECPPGFGRVLDISTPANPVLLSTFAIEGMHDAYDPASGRFTCPRGQQSIHQPYFDPRSSGSLFYQPWYDQGVRAMDISNPYQPREVGYYLSPDYSVLPTYPGRHTREVFVDPDTNLLYVTDGNGGGLTVLRYTGALPTAPPIPGAR